MIATCLDCSFVLFSLLLPSQSWPRRSGLQGLPPAGSSNVRYSTDFSRHGYPAFAGSPRIAEALKQVDGLNCCGLD